MAENDTYTNREAHSTSKGFRLQKLRAVEMMVEAEKMPDDTVMYWAIERHEDVYQKSDGETILEEDKSYDSSSSFTFNSAEVKKALVSFIDLWIYYDYSALLKFNFYSSNKIGSERNSSVIQNEGIILPEGKMLELASAEELSTEFLTAAIKFILHEIKETYGEKSEKYKLVSAWENATWITFFQLITWKFEQPNETELDELVIAKIKQCRWFSTSLHDGMEDYIKSKLIDELDKRQSKEDFFSRIINKSDVRLIFELAKKGSTIKKDDSLWKMWDSIAPPLDKRNVSEKLSSIWHDITEKQIIHFSTNATEGGIERDSYSGEKDFMALRYRIYRCCQIELSKIINSDSFYLDFSPEECVQALFDSAKHKVIELSNQYEYGYSNDDLIYNVIMELIDNCYLAFDNE